MTQFYGKQIYLIQLFMRGCIWYGLFILFGYQVSLKTGEFHPLLSMLIIPVMLFFWFLRNTIKNQKLKWLALIVVPILLIVFTDFPWYFLLIEAALQISNEIFKEDKVQNFGVFWETWLYKLPGILLMLFLLILHSIWSQSNIPDLAYTPEYAGGFLLGAWVLFLILYMINNYMKNFYRHFSRRYGPIQKEAFNRAKRSNYAMMVILGVCGIVGMILFTFVPMGIYEKIVSALKILLASLLGIALENIPKTGMNNQSAEYFGTIGAAPIGVGGEGIQFNENIFSGILIAGLITLLVMLIIKIYRGFLVRYQVETDTAEFVSPREEEEESYGEKRRRFFSVRFGNSNRDKIRKMYYQTILKRFSRQTKERQNKVSNVHTPSDLSRLLSSTPGEKQVLDEMTVYYEKARFGKEESTEEDVEKVRNLL